VQDPSLKFQSLKTKSVTFFLYAAFCLTRFSFIAAAQQSTYSADSLMEALKKGSNISVKGTEITFTDVVVESKKSSVLFRSSGNHKVTCELASPIRNANTKLLVGTPLTVVGKVRGRGILGNVTLDDCSPALSVATADSNSSNAAPVEPVAVPAAAPEQPEEQPEIPIENPPETGVADTITTDARPVSTKSRSPRAAVPAPKPGTDVIPSEPLSSEPTEQSDVTGVAVSTKAAVHVAFYVRVAVFAGFALLLFVKVLPALIAKRSRPPLNKPISLEMRRAAIEALLSGKKKTWRERLKFKRAS
jgi:hypothetical protein